jgi:hypothetical protein
LPKVVGQARQVTGVSLMVEHKPMDCYCMDEMEYTRYTTPEVNKAQRASCKHQPSGMRQQLIRCSIQQGMRAVKQVHIMHLAQIFQR